VPIVPEIQDRLRAAFPQANDVALARAAREGVLLADDLYSGGTLLDNVLGRDLRGHIRRVGIAYRIIEFCRRGDLPFSAEMTSMPRGRWHWLQIRGTGVLAHACRTDEVFAFPDEAESRQDLRLALQPNLLSWSERDKSLGEISKEVPELYAWLTYRVADDGNLCHLCLASPAPDDNQWLAHVSILREIDLAGRAPPPLPPVADPKEKLRFKEHVQQTLGRTNDNKVSSE